MLLVIVILVMLLVDCGVIYLLFMFNMFVGGMMVVIGVNMFNCVVDVDIDKVMK